MASKSRAKIVTLSDKSIRYFDILTQERWQPTVCQFPNEWYYFDQDGKAVTGLQQVGQQTLYFTKTANKSKEKVVDVNGVVRYFDANSGDMAREANG